MVFTSENDLDLGVSSVTDGNNMAFNLIFLVLPFHWASLDLDLIHVAIFRGVICHPLWLLLKTIKGYSHLKQRIIYLLNVLLIHSVAPEEGDDKNYHC